MGPRKVPKPWAEEQQRLAKLRVDQDQMDWTAHGQFICGLDRVGGVDVSFFPDQSYAVAAVVVLSFKSFEVLYARCANIRLAVPYIPGYLAFREVPALATLLAQIPEALTPQVVLVDGNGAFHPRRCGAATHLGIIADLPTIGVAKTVQKVDDVNQKRAFKLAKQLHGASEWVPLTGEASSKEDEPLAMLLRPSSGKGTLVVSVGHRVSLSTAVVLTAALCRHGRVPEPIRQADLQSRGAVREWFDGKDAGDLDVREGLLPALPAPKRPAPEEPEQPSHTRKTKSYKERHEVAGAEAADSVTGTAKADAPVAATAGAPLAVSVKGAQGSTPASKSLKSAARGFVWRVKVKAASVTSEDTDAVVLGLQEDHKEECKEERKEDEEDEQEVGFWAGCVLWLGGLCVCGSR